MLSPSDRYVVLGKTGTGKTFASLYLARYIGDAQTSPRWRFVFIDTKGVTEDRRRAQKLGFKSVKLKDLAKSSEKYIIVSLSSDEKSSIKDKAARVFRWAYRRQYVMVIVDEYTQVVESKMNAGEDLLNIFTRGRGRHVGIIGDTQEPVGIPRQLFSQASHVFIFRLWAANDIKAVKEVFSQYEPPRQSHGFYYRWVDGDDLHWTYYEKLQDFLTV